MLYMRKKLDKVKAIIKIIEERIDDARAEVKEHKSERSKGFNYDLGFLDSLLYLMQEIQDELKL